MSKNIVYLVHGGNKFYDQARLSILTLLDPLFKQGREDYQIVVYCDKPHLLPQHEFVRSRPVTPEQLQRWRGPLDFVHRIKLEMLRDAASRFQDPFIFVDCDTRWLRLPDAEFEALSAPAAAGQKPAFFMHMNDGEISATFYPHYFRHLNRHAAMQLAPWHIKPGPWQMWNSGVIGVAPSIAGTFFDDALAISDLLHLYLRPRIFTEQCAFALLAATRFDVRPFDHCLHHYWDYSFEAPTYLDSIFAGLDPALSLEQQADYCGRFKWDESKLRAIRSLRSTRFRRWIAKVRNSLNKRRIDVKAAQLRRALHRGSVAPQS